MGVCDCAVMHIICVMFIYSFVHFSINIYSAPPVCHVLCGALGTQRRPGQKSLLSFVVQWEIQNYTEYNCNLCLLHSGEEWGRGKDRTAERPALVGKGGLSEGHLG